MKIFENENGTITKEWAKFIASIRYEDLPSEVVNSVKISVLDTIGAMLAGTTSQTYKSIMKLVTAWGGKQESTLIGEGIKIPAAYAALSNAIAARVRELDDALEMLPFHASAVVVPVALAMAEQKGFLNGKDFITAIALGVDIAGRMGLASKTTGINRVPSARSIWGTIGAATVACKVYGLDEKKILNALGLAYRLGGGNEVIGARNSSDETIWLGCGKDAMDGVLACSLAREGFAGPSDVIEAYYCSFERGEYHRDALLDNLGVKFVITQTSLKAWPTCRMTHAAIDGTLQLVFLYDILPDDVDQIIVSLNRLAYERVCLPLEKTRNPKSLTDALFSVPFTVATAIIKKRVSLIDLTEKIVNDANILSMSRKVVPKLNPEIKHPVGRPPAIVEIKTTNGLSYIKQIEYIKGHPFKNPLTQQERISKFMDCASIAKKPLSRAEVENTMNFVDHLEEMNDVKELPQFIFNRD